jgi:UDP-glucose 4-epimerase
MAQLTSDSRSALITGASGHLGSLLVSELTKEGWSIFAVSRRDSFTHLSNVTHIPHEWSNSIAFEIPRVDTVFHLAAQTSAYKARENVAEDIHSNVVGTVNLLESIARSNVKPVFIFTGSMTEYGMTSTYPVDEKVPLSPQTFYDAAKITTEMYAEQFVREGWLSKSITLRLSNVYGSHSRAQGVDRGFLDRSILKALTGEPLFFFGSGEYVRDFLHVDDVISALISAALHVDDLDSSVFNIGTGFGTTIKSALALIAKEAENLTGSPVQVNQGVFPVDSYAIERRNSIANSQVFREATGWTPKVEFRTGVKEGLKEVWSSISPR